MKKAKYVTDKRKADLFDQIVSWACEHDDEFVEAMLASTDMLEQEALDLGLEEYYNPDFS